MCMQLLALNGNGYTLKGDNFVKISFDTVLERRFLYKEHNAPRRSIWLLLE